MARFSVNQLSEITGKDRRTVKKRLEELEPAGKQGRAVLYESKTALPMIYELGSAVDVEGITLDEARRNESVAKTEKLHLEMESIRKQRIPVEVVNDTLDECLGAMKAVTKRSKLKPDEKAEIYRELREVPRRLKW